MRNEWNAARRALRTATLPSGVCSIFFSGCAAADDVPSVPPPRRPTVASTDGEKRYGPRFRASRARARACRMGLFGLRARFSRNEIVQRVVHAASASVANRFRPLAYSAPVSGRPSASCRRNTIISMGPFLFTDLHSRRARFNYLLLSTYYLLFTWNTTFRYFHQVLTSFVTVLYARKLPTPRHHLDGQRPRRIGRFYPLIDNIILYPHGQLEENRFFYFFKPFMAWVPSSEAGPCRVAYIHAQYILNTNVLFHRKVNWNIIVIRLLTA